MLKETDWLCECDTVGVVVSDEDTENDDESDRVDDSECVGDAECDCDWEEEVVRLGVVVDERERTIVGVEVSVSDGLCVEVAEVVKVCDPVVDRKNVCVIDKDRMLETDNESDDVVVRVDDIVLVADTDCVDEADMEGSRVVVNEVVVEKVNEVDNVLVTERESDWLLLTESEELEDND